jgi:hypothetical protein
VAIGVATSHAMAGQAAMAMAMTNHRSAAEREDKIDLTRRILTGDARPCLIMA